MDILNSSRLSLRLNPKNPNSKLRVSRLSGLGMVTGHHSLFRAGLERVRGVRLCVFKLQLPGFPGLYASREVSGRQHDFWSFSTLESARSLTDSLP